MSKNLNYVGEQSLKRFMCLFNFLKEYGISYKEAAEKMGISYPIINNAKNSGRLTYENYNLVMSRAETYFTEVLEKTLSEWKSIMPLVHAWSEDAQINVSVVDYLRTN